MEPITSAKINSTESIVINGVDEGSLVHALLNRFRTIDEEDMDALAGVSLLKSEIERWLRQGEIAYAELLHESQANIQLVSTLQGKVDALKAEIAKLTAPPVPDWSSWRTSLMSDDGFLMYAVKLRGNPLHAQILSLLQHTIAMERPSEKLITDFWNKLNTLVPATNISFKPWNDRGIEFGVPLRWDAKTGFAAILPPPAKV
jgi:hypothetical protein